MQSNDRILPSCEEHDMEIEGLRTGNGRKYCGRSASHSFERYLAIQQIQYRQTDFSSLETISFCERFHCTVKEEFCTLTFSKTFYESLQQFHNDLDAYVSFYNRERSHRDDRAHSRISHQTFSEGL